jgi:hypothetical protein
MHTVWPNARPLWCRASCVRYETEPRPRHPLKAARSVKGAISFWGRRGVRIVPAGVCSLSSQQVLVELLNRNRIGWIKLDRCRWTLPTLRTQLLV